MLQIESKEDPGPPGPVLAVAIAFAFACANPGLDEYLLVDVLLLPRVVVRVWLALEMNYLFGLISATVE